jgi:CspA family cold shock protein
LPYYKLLLQLQCVQVQLNFNESKGYGFITDEETGKDIFVHASGINAEELREGDRGYEEEEGKGKVAASSSYLIFFT